MRCSIAPQLLSLNYSSIDFIIPSSYFLLFPLIILFYILRSYKYLYFVCSVSFWSISIRACSLISKVFLTMANHQFPLFSVISALLAPCNANSITWISIRAHITDLFNIFLSLLFQWVDTWSVWLPQMPSKDLHVPLWMSFLWMSCTIYSWVFLLRKINQKSSIFFSFY